MKYLNVTKVSDDEKSRDVTVKEIYYKYNEFKTENNRDSHNEEGVHYVKEKKKKEVRCSNYEQIGHYRKICPTNINKNFKTKVQKEEANLFISNTYN